MNPNTGYILAGYVHALNWSTGPECTRPLPIVPCKWELFCLAQGWTEQQAVAIAESKGEGWRRIYAFASRHKQRRYVPEAVLKAFGFDLGWNLRGGE